MDIHSTPLPDDHIIGLAAVVQAHGNRWEVGQEPDTGVWLPSNALPQPHCTLSLITLWLALPPSSTQMTSCT